MEPVNEELDELQPSSLQQHSNVFNTFLQEDHSEAADIFRQLPRVPKHNNPPFPADFDPDSHSSFNIHTIAKQDSNRHLPQKLDPPPDPDDPLDMALPRKVKEEEELQIKRFCQTDRMAYLRETRAQKIERYLEKKVRRQWSRKISYNCRKVVADKRERKKGRFVRKEQLTGTADSSAKKSSRETGDGEGEREVKEEACEEGEREVKEEACEEAIIVAYYD